MMRSAIISHLLSKSLISLLVYWFPSSILSLLALMYNTLPHSCVSERIMYNFSYWILISPPALSGLGDLTPA